MMIKPMTSSISHLLRIKFLQLTLVSALLLACSPDADAGSCDSIGGKPNVCPNRSVVWGSSLAVSFAAPKSHPRCQLGAENKYVCMSKDQHKAFKESWPYGPDDWTLYYTTDGSLPTRASAQINPNQKIRIKPLTGRAAAVVRVVGFAPDGTMSRINTSTYVFRAHLNDQIVGPGDLPQTWGNTDQGTTSSDYVLDKRVIEQKGQTQIMEALSDLSVMSIVGSDREIFSLECGIYANPELENNAIRSGGDCSDYSKSNSDRWVRTASIELIEADQQIDDDDSVSYDGKGETGFQIDSGLQIQGGSSQTQWKAKKLSMKVDFREEYGEKNLSYPLFVDETAVSKFDSLIFDAHINYTFIHDSPLQYLKPTYWADAVAGDLLNALGDPNVHSRFVHLFINGLYWGVYDVHERPDKHFAKSYFGGDDDSYDVFKHGPSGQISGDSKNNWNAIWQKKSKLDSNKFYNQLSEIVDIDAFIRYMLVNFWIANEDWPHKNFYTIYNQTDANVKWRFLSWDAEKSFGNHNSNIVGDIDNDKKFKETAGDLFRNLMRNSQFKQRVMTTYEQLIAPGGGLSQSKVTEVIRTRQDSLKSAIILEAARWADVQSNDPLALLEAWYSHVNYIRQTFIPSRSEIVRSHLNSY